METKKEAAQEIINEAADRLSIRITSGVDRETWHLARLGAMKRNILVGEWVAEAIKEKYQWENSGARPAAAESVIVSQRTASL